MKSEFIIDLELKCCGMSFPNADEFAKHTESVHGKGALKCCGMSFPTADEFAKHHRSVHGAP